MNKKLDWFKFSATDWLSGSVQLLSDGEKGTFIDLIAMIWKGQGSIEVNNILYRKLRIDSATACERIESYCDLGILVMRDNELSMKFLDEQIEDIKSTSKKNSDNAKKRWDKDSKKCDRMPIREEKTRAEKTRTEKIRTDKNQDMIVFDEFRKLYGGTKNGNKTEFDNFVKKHKDWREVLPDLKAIVETQINIRSMKVANNVFCPEWKNLSVWINKRCWEQEESPGPLEQQEAMSPLEKAKLQRGIK